MQRAKTNIHTSHSPIRPKHARTYMRIIPIKQAPHYTYLRHASYKVIHKKLTKVHIKKYMCKFLRIILHKISLF